MKDLGKYVMYGTSVIDTNRIYNLKVDLEEKKKGCMTYTISAEKWLKAMREECHRKRKPLLYAVTHGYRVHFIEMIGGSLSYIEITKPSEINRWYRMTSLLTTIRIYDKTMRSYVIRKGKIVPHKIWSVSQRMIDEWEKKMVHFGKCAD